MLVNSRQCRAVHPMPSWSSTPSKYPGPTHRDTHCKNLLPRLGSCCDAIFYGLLVFPVFGSALAGMASYLRRDNRTRRLRLLQRVLDLVRKAHGARNLEALEQLQVEADNLVIAIVHQGEREEFDETVRMSFAFALD